MALILLEGMDKVGKTTVAKYFSDQGFTYVHMTAPQKGISRPAYLAEMLVAVARTADSNVIIDRTWMGELIWPYVFSRTPLLFDSDIKAIQSLCDAMHNGDVRKIYMHDPDKESHRLRMAKFKEPSYNYDLVHTLYGTVMKSYGFQFLTFQEAEAIGWISKKD